MEYQVPSLGSPASVVFEVMPKCTFEGREATVKVALVICLPYHLKRRERVLAWGSSYRDALTLTSPSFAFREEVFRIQPPPKEGRRVRSRCTRQRMARRVGPSGYYSSTLSTGSRARSERRGCSEKYKASSRWAKKRWVQLTLILTLLLVVGITAVLLSRIMFSGASYATNATGEEAPFSSKSSISELPRTGGPRMHT